MGTNAGANAYASPLVVKAKGWAIALTLVFTTVVAGIGFTLATISLVPPEFNTVSSVVTSGLAAVAVFATYLFLTNKSVSYVDVPGFSARAIGIGILIGGVLTAVQAGLTILFASQGIGEAVGPIGRLIQGRGVEFLVTLVVANLLVTAPAEELLYRNGVQKLLSRSHSTAFAIVGASLVFTLPHVLNLVLASQAELLTGLLEIFVNGVGYGAAYAYWNRLDVTIVAHGLYNSAVFVFAYLHVFGS